MRYATGERDRARAPVAGQARAARRQPAVVTLVELRNFTRISEVLEPDMALELADEFFALAAAALAAHEGEVFAVQNDALLGAFRRGGAAQFAQQAVLAAQAIQREFGALAESWEQGYGMKAAVALGLHLGETVFGIAGPQGDRRPVVFGDAVSVAGRLAHRARAGEFVLSESLNAVLADTDFALQAEALPALELLRRPPIPIYGVLLDTRLDFT